MDPATIALTFRRVLLSGILGLALLIPASVIPWPGSAATCAAASTHRVAVVVQHLDGATVSRCVPFTADTIGGEQALAGSKIQAGLLPSGGFGKAVCQLDNEPTTYPQTCWTGTSPFWALFVDHGGGWSYSSVGLSSIVLHDGDSLGFRYQSQSQHAAPSIPGGLPGPDLAARDSETDGQTNAASDRPPDADARAHLHAGAPAWEPGRDGRALDARDVPGAFGDRRRRRGRDGPAGSEPDLGASRFTAVRFDLCAG